MPKSLCLTVILALSVLAACSPAATPVPTAPAPTAAVPTAPVAASSAPTIAAPTAPAPTTAAPTSAPTAAPTSAAPVVLNIMTHDSFAASDNVIAAFEQANNIKTQFLKSGDAGNALNKAILSKDAPLADVFYGVDNTLLSKALQADLFVPYTSPVLAQELIPAAFQLDPTNRELPVDYGDVCINYDKAYFSGKKLAPPQSLEDLGRPQYRGLLVTENPATSSTGLAFMLATVKHFGPDNFVGFWKQLRANDVKVDDGWETAYYTDFSGSSGKGPRPLVVSYASSPPAEVVGVTPEPTEAPIGSLIAPDTCFRQIEFVGILKGTQHLAEAEKWVDFMLSGQFQADMPLQMYVFPVDPAAPLPAVFTRWAQIPAQPASLAPDDITAHRDAWITDWTTAVLR
jgi:thiamine transport system substrate-binding protein